MPAVTRFVSTITSDKLGSSDQSTPGCVDAGRLKELLPRFHSYPPTSCTLSIQAYAALKLTKLFSPA